MEAQTQSKIKISLPSNQRFLRRDFVSAHIVDVGISLQQKFGTREAADFLKDNFIHLNVAMRVLLHPSRRRL